jgi:hypothetical protein
VSQNEPVPSALLRAFDELRFGTSRTLNLRAQQPTASQATTQTEAWLRTLQVQGAPDALIITGRGNRSVEGYSPVREAIVRLLPSLRRRNVISGFEEHSPGSFIVTFAPVRALFEAPARRRERSPRTAAALPGALQALNPETQQSLRDLALLALAVLGLKSPTKAQIEDEMHRQFAVLTGALPENGDREALLQQAILRAAEEFENEG